MQIFSGTFSNLGTQPAKYDLAIGWFAEVSTGPSLIKDFSHWVFK